MLNKNTFSIDKEINPLTKRPFGEQYAGEFTVRRPTLADKRDISIRDQAFLNALGPVDQRQMETSVVNINYIFANFDVIVEKKPDWCDISALYEGDDEEAVHAVWGEVQKFLNSFRSSTDSRDSGKRGEAT